MLAECYRGRGTDAAVDHMVRRAGEVTTTTLGDARLAGGLLARHRLDSCHAVDALVVAAAVGQGGGVVLTGDPEDLGRLSAAYPHVEVWPIAATPAGRPARPPTEG
ncbi:MAG: hypothetical protein ACRD0J_15090 [Acidimicrobiales bacterium]